MRVDIYIYTYICKYIFICNLYMYIYIYCLFIDLLTVDGSRLDIHYNGKLKKIERSLPVVRAEELVEL